MAGYTTDMQESARFGNFSLLQPRAVTRRYPKKQIILLQGEEPKHTYIIKNGFVRSYGIAADGDRRTVSLLGAGDVFPMSWIFGKSETCIYNFEAMTDCAIMTLPKKEYLAALEMYPALKDQVFDNYMSHYIAAIMHVYALEHSYAQEKVAYILHYLATRFGERQPDGRVKIGLRLSHQDIAEMIGVTRETAAVELHRLKEQGYIQYQKFTYSIDLAKLLGRQGEGVLESPRVQM